MKLRRTNLKKLKTESFDVMVVGGGINGAVSAAALAAKGANVALIDKGDFASFTSQQSSISLGAASSTWRATNFHSFESSANAEITSSRVTLPRLKRSDFSRRSRVAFGTIDF